MKVISSLQNTSSNKNLSPQHQGKIFSFKGYNFAKTLEKADIDSSNSKYYKNGMPVLAKYVNQAYFGVQKYSDETTRFLGVDGVACCTKFTMHDPKTQTGFLSHLDSSFRLLNPFSIDNVKRAISDLNPDNIFVRHLRGSFYRTEDFVLSATLGFMQKLKIPEKNLIEENLFSSKKGATGLILDIKTGQTYNISSMPRVKPDEFYKYKNNLTPQEYDVFLKNQKLMNTIPFNDKVYLSNINK